MGDTELAAAIRNVLKWDADLPEEMIEVIVVVPRAIDDGDIRANIEKAMARRIPHAARE